VNCPYVGPTPLDSSRHVFGRDAEIEELGWRVTADRIIVLYSSSGAGKTSLLMAKNGLLAQLASRFQVLPTIRISGNKLVDPVAATLLRLAAEFGPAEPGDSLGTYFERIRISEHQPPRRLLIVFDQFEEIFSAGSQAAQQHAFFQQLGVLLARENSPVWAIFSMREEYFSWLDEYRDLVPTRLNNTFRLNLLTVEQAIAAIKGPAEAQGITFPVEDGDDAAMRLAGELSKVRVRNAHGKDEIKPGTRVEPVQLQVICLDLWRRLSGRGQPIEQIRITDVVDFDPAKALQEYCDSALDRAAADRGRGRVLRDWIDHRLLTPGGVRLPAMVDPADPRDPTDEELKSLEEIHLIRRQTREDNAWYELSHDSLALPVRRSIEGWRIANLQPWQIMARVWQLGGRQARYFGTLSQQQMHQIPRPDPASTGTEAAFLDAYAMYRQHSAKSRLFVAAIVSLLVVMGILSLDRITKTAVLVAERNVTAVQAGVLAILSGNPSIGLGARAAVTGTQLQKDNPTTVAFNFRSLLSTFLNENRHVISVEAEGNGVSAIVLADGEHRVVLEVGEAGYAVQIEDLARKGRVWHIDSALLKQKHPRGIRTAVLLGNGRLATGGGDGRIQLWDMRTRQADGAPLISRTSQHRALLDSPVRSMAVAGDLLYAGHEQGVVAAWHIGGSAGPRDVEPAWTARAQARVSALAPWAGGKGVAFADISGEEHVTLVSSSGGTRRSAELVASPKENNYRGAFYSIAISGDERFVAAGSRAGKIHVWDIAARRHVLRIDAHDQAVAQLKFLRTGELLSIGWDGRIKRWQLFSDPAGGVLERQLLEFRRQLVSLALDPNEREAHVSSGKGDILKVSLAPDIVPHGRVVWGRGVLADVSESAGPKTWSSATAMDAPTRLLRPGSAVIAHAKDAKITFIANGNRIDAVQDGQPDRGPVTLLANTFGPIKSVHSNDKGTLLIVRTEGATSVWALPSSGVPAVECTRNRHLPLDFPRSTRVVAMRPGSSDFVTVSSGAQYWSVGPAGAGCPTIRSQHGKLPLIKAEIQAASFDKEGRLLWAGDYIGQVYSVDVDSPAPQARPVQSEAIAPPSAIAVGADQTIAVGDAQGGLYVFQPGSKFPVKLAQQFHRSEITALNISGDGRAMVSSSGEGTVLWNLDIGSWIARACNLANHRGFNELENRTYFNRVSDKPTPCASPD